MIECMCFDSAPSSVSLERQYIDAFKAELEWKHVEEDEYEFMRI